jgi:hypothetical protein
MRYRLRTLVMLTAIGPPALAAIWFWGLPILFVLWIFCGLLLELAELGPLALWPLGLPFALAWAFSLVAKLLIHINTHPDNRR